MQKSGQNIITPSMIDTFCCWWYLCTILRLINFLHKSTKAKSSIWYQQSKKIQPLLLFNLNLGFSFTEMVYSDKSQESISKKGREIRIKWPKIAKDTSLMVLLIKAVMFIIFMKIFLQFTNQKKKKMARFTFLIFYLEFETSFSWFSLKLTWLQGFPKIWSKAL